MISRAALNERVQEWGLWPNIVEKDYVIGWVLRGIGSHPRLSASWAFKGGTCLKKCYVETYRFSEDLDFTVLPGGPIEPGEVASILGEVLARVYDEAGIDFSGRAPVVRTRPDGRSVEGRIYYRGPVASAEVASIKLDLTSAESVVRPTVLRSISHPYPDQLPAPAEVRCYAFEELFAEKIRAMVERCRPRDLYDIVNLFRRRDFLPHGELLHSIYVEKCRGKGVDVVTLDSLETSLDRAEAESEWANMLEHQLPALPPFDDFWQELPRLFAWLEGKAVPEELPSIPQGNTDDVEWTPPPTVWVWGKGVALETVRFAAANHLCVELGYQGSMRLMEPYSLRRTRDGNLLLYGIKVTTQELRAYRVDRIQSLKVTNKPFKPRFAIEFSASGSLTVLPAKPGRVSRTRTRTGGSGVVYIIECTYCKRRFRRARLETRLLPHKTKDGWDCSGRIGHLVDQRYV